MERWAVPKWVRDVLGTLGSEQAQQDYQTNVPFINVAFVNPVELPFMLLVFGIILIVVGVRNLNHSRDSFQVDWLRRKFDIEHTPSWQSLRNTGLGYIVSGTLIALIGAWYVFGLLYPFLADYYFSP